MSRQWLVLPAEDLPFAEEMPVRPAPTLPALQSHVGGYVEVVRLDLGTTEIDMWCNEEGAYSGLPVNHRATLLAKLFAPHTLLMPQGIQGGVVLASADRMGETVGLAPDVLTRLTDLLTTITPGVTP